MLFIRRLRSLKQKQKENQQTLEEFLKSNCLYFEINEQLDYALKSYLLTKYKTKRNGANPRINYTWICNDGEISKDMAVKLVRHWQKSIANYSCQYIKLMAPHTAELLIRYDDDCRLILPSFFVMQQILSEIKNKKFNILLKIYNPVKPATLELPLVFHSESDRFIVSSDISQHRGYFVIQAISNSLSENNQAFFIKKILSFGIEKVFLTSCANHPQYSGNKLNFLNQSNVYKRLFIALKRIFQEDVKIGYLSDLYALSCDYEAMKKLAITHQCDHRKPNFLFIEHMYAGI